MIRHTGGLEKGRTILETAQQELWEEAGYKAEQKEFINLGQVRPSKSSDTIVHIFGINVTKKIQSKPKGNGSYYEKNASVEWIDYKSGIQIVDPLFVTAITRLLNKLGEA